MKSQAHASPIEPEIAPADAPARLEPPVATTIPVKRERPGSMVARIMSGALTRAKHQRVDMEDAFRWYTAACRGEGRDPVDPNFQLMARS